MKRAAWLAAASLSAGSGTLLAGLGLIGTAGYLISRAAERPPILDLVLLFVAVRCFGLTRPVLRYLERLASHDLMFRILKTVRGWFVGALLPLSHGQLMAFRSGDLLSRMAADVDALQESYLRVGAPALVAIAVSTALTAGLALLDLRLASWVLGLLLAYGIGWSWFAYRQSRASGNRRNDTRRTFSADLVATMQARDDVLACGFEDRAARRFAGLQHHLDALDTREGRRLALHAAAGVAFMLLASWAVLVICLDAVYKGHMPAVWIAPLVLVTIASFEAVEGLPAAWQSAVQTRDSGRRVLEIMRTRPAVVEAHAPRLIHQGAPSIHLHRVTFNYPGGATVLRGVSCEIAAGEHLAVVGDTGAGKSTLLALLMRSWDPTDGAVYISGTDLREAALDQFRTQLAVLPQHVHVFNDTLRENVRLGRRAATDTEVRRAVSRAGLGRFLSRAECGLDTRLGEHGVRMSAGERQRLSLARALLTDATLVLADEPTANLDAASERAFFATLHEWARGRTLVVVSHRQAALRSADRVLALRHAQLLAVGETTGSEGARR